MKKNLYITQEEVAKKVQEDLQKALKPLLGAPAEKIKDQAERIAQYVLAKVVRNIPDAEPIEFTTKVVGNDVVFTALNMTTLSVLEGLDLRGKTVLETDEYIFWHFDRATIRKEKRSGSLLFIPGHIMKNVSAETIQKIVTDTVKKDRSIGETSFNPEVIKYILCPFCKCALTDEENDLYSHVDPSERICTQCSDELTKITE